MERKVYSTDLTDEQWQRLQEHLPKAATGRTGRPRKHELREVVNALFYQLRNGGAWRNLPHDLPPWETVYNQFRRWRNDATLEVLHLDLRQLLRQQDGREASPSAAVLDSQSVKAGERGGRKAVSAMTPTRRSKAGGGTCS